MWTKTEMFVARLHFIPITCFFVFILFDKFGKSLNELVYNLTEDSSYHIFLRFDTREAVVFWLSVSWIILHILAEIAAYIYEKFKFRFRRFLTNVRYAPIAILIFSLLIILVYDAGMIEYSKWQIRSYVYSKSQSIEEPDISLFNNYRHWCGNGASAQENYLYFDTAAEGINDENPHVRARSLLMSSKVRNWINGGDKRFDDFLAKSCRDSAGIVRETAEKYLNDWESSCQKYLSIK